MRAVLSLGLIGALAACGGAEPQLDVVPVPPIAARLPRTPGEHGPSLVAIQRTPKAPGDVSDGTMLSDVDSCATCHADAAAQWATSAHSFASFGNPIYRFNVELARHELGDKRDASTAAAVTTCR